MPLRRNATWHYDTQFLYSLSRAHTHTRNKKLHNFQMHRDAAIFTVEWKIMMSNCDWKKRRFFFLLTFVESLAKRKMTWKRAIFLSVKKLLNYETKKCCFNLNDLNMTACDSFTRKISRSVCMWSFLFCSSSSGSQHTQDSLSISLLFL